ncbi:MAG TPA: pyridoxal-phosphate dependent enzyme [Conexivisphaerales archaeon]|nr:pyridoxal-phosphate dependent enzyme [Conexivisphaerales archaeon]
MGWTTSCMDCGRPSGGPLDWRCSCGGALETRVDVEYSSPSREGTVFERFSDLYPYIPSEELVSLGETQTPLVKADGALFKLEYLLPTGSFKDRGSCALISGVRRELRSKGLGRVKEDSSGNAGASVAAYSARAGIGCEVFVPAAVSGPKALQIQMYGAKLVGVRGSRGDVTIAAQRESEGSAYVGHIWHPYFRDGMRTLAYEIYEQMGGRLPGRVYLPVSAGTLLLGFLSGLGHLKESGSVDRLPEVVACQTEEVSPLHRKLMGLPYRPPEGVDTLADALVSTSPPLLKHMATRLKEEGGRTEVVGEAELLQAWRELAGKGFYVEPSSAVPYACLERAPEGERAGSLVILTGSGLKSRQEALRRALG